MSTGLQVLAAIFLIVGIIVVIALLTALPIMLLINWLIVPKLIYAIFGVYKLGFWKSLGIGLLSGCLFKGSYNTSK